MPDNTSQQQENKQVDALLANLPEYTPKRDLWPGIEQGLLHQAKPASNARGLYAIAASICFVAVLGFLASTQQLWFESKDHKAGLALIDALDIQHKQTKATLLVKYNDVKPIASNWQAQLDELDSAAQVVKQALAEDPTNRALLQMLQYIYQQQIDVIEKSHATTTWQQI